MPTKARHAPACWSRAGASAGRAPRKSRPWRPSHPMPRSSWCTPPAMRYTGHAGRLCLTIDLRGHEAHVAQRDTVTHAQNLNDLLATYDWLCSQGGADPESMAVVGISYAGSPWKQRRTVRWPPRSTTKRYPGRWSRITGQRSETLAPSPCVPWPVPIMDSAKSPCSVLIPACRWDGLTEMLVGARGDAAKSRVAQFQQTQARAKGLHGGSERRCGSVPFTAQRCLPFSVVAPADPVLAAARSRECRAARQVDGAARRPIQRLCRQRRPTPRSALPRPRAAPRPRSRCAGRPSGRRQGHAGGS